jgi:hypothetical protein
LFTTIDQNEFLKNEKLNFNFNITGVENELLTKIKSKSKPLKDFCDAYFGIQTFDRRKYVSLEKETDSYMPVIDGSNIQYYYLKEPVEYVNFTPDAIKSGGNEFVYRQEKICIRQIGNVPVSTLVPANIFGLNTLYSVYPKDENGIDLKFALGVINSKVTKFYWRKFNSDEKKTFPKIKKEAILSIQIPNVSDIKQKNEIVFCVEQLLKLNNELMAATLENKREQIKQKLQYNEDKIDTLIYKLYDLSETEIQLIENGN